MSIDQQSPVYEGGKKLAKLLGELTITATVIMTQAPGLAQTVTVQSASGSGEETPTTCPQPLDPSSPTPRPMPGNPVPCKESII